MSKRRIYTSEFSGYKQRDYAAHLLVSMRMCKSILGRHEWAHPVYHYFDLYAGPGTDGIDEGSPIIFLKTAQLVGLPVRAWFFERSPRKAKILRRSVEEYLGKSDGFSAEVSVLVGDNASAVPDVIDAISRESRRVFGLVYADPYGPPSFDVLRVFSAHRFLERLDLLIYLNATALKMCLGHPHCPRHKTGLDEGLASLGKRVVHVRECLGAWQWSFAYCTNTERFPQLRQNGFHSIATERGRKILTRLTCTREELKAMGFELHPREFQRPLFT